MRRSSRYLRFGRLSALAVIAFVAMTCGREPQTATSPDVQAPTELTYGTGELSRSLVLIVPPAGAVAGEVFTTQPQVEFRSAHGRLLPVGQSVTASLVGTSEVLGGTTSIAAVHGVATFSDLAISTAGTYTIEFTAPGASSVIANLVVAPSCEYSGTLIDTGLGMVVSGGGRIGSIYDAGGTFSATVTVNPSDCVWEPVSNRSWITIDAPGARTGDGFFTFSVDPLAHSSAERSGSIALTSPSGSTGVTFALSQAH